MQLYFVGRKVKVGVLTICLRSTPEIYPGADALQSSLTNSDFTVLLLLGDDSNDLPRLYLDFIVIFVKL